MDISKLIYLYSISEFYCSRHRKKVFTAAFIFPLLPRLAADFIFLTTLSLHVNVLL